MDKSFVLRGNICQTITPHEVNLHENSFLVCENGVSRGIFRELPEMYAELALVDYGDFLIFPGMTDLHIHAPQFSFRGSCMDLELMDWLRRYTFPEEEKYDDLAYAQRAYELFSLAMKKSVTTRACIFGTRHCPATELLMEKMEKSGLISYVGKVNMDRGATDALNEKSAEASVNATIQWLEATKGKFKNTMPVLTPRFIPSCTDKLMEGLEKIRSDYSLPVQSHLSESKSEIEYVKSLRPKNRFYGEAYDDYSLFGKNNETGEAVKTVMAHCVWSCDDEIELIRKNGVFVAHCPSSNINLTSGIAPIRKYIEKGIKIGLGTDVAGGHSESLFRAVTDAIQASKMYYRLVDEGSEPLGFSEAFYLATKGGGEFFGKTGSFEEGYEFDAVVIDDSVIPHPQRLTLCERMERAVYLGLDLCGIVGKYVSGQAVFEK